MPEKNVSYIEDKDLLQRFYTDLDNYWLGILLPRYTMLLLGVCMKYLKNQEDAKDAVQQIFLKVINELPKYQVTYFKSWIYMIAKNYCLMQLRSKPLERLLADENIDTAADISENIFDREQKEISLNELERALKELNSEQYTCVKSFYIDKKSYLQIAESTGYTLLQVKSNIQNGKRNLKQVLLRKGITNNK